MIRVKLPEFTKLPLVPTTVIVEFPMNVALLYAAVRVRVALSELDVVIVEGEKAAVTPFGNPLTESPTVPLNPFIGEAFT